MSLAPPPGSGMGHVWSTGNPNRLPWVRQNESHTSWSETAPSRGLGTPYS